MNAYGSDRMTCGEDGVVELSAQTPKPGWEGRQRRTTSREHPGSAVLWDGELYEVLKVVQLAHEVRYTLAVWQDNHTVRALFLYDAESERLRAAERHDTKRRNAQRRLATLAGLATGHLPTTVQQHLAHELGANAPMLTMMSACAEIALAICVLGAAVGVKYSETAGPPVWAIILAFFFVFDGPSRLGFAFLRAQPIGSLVGLAAYTLFCLIQRNRTRLPQPIAMAAHSIAAPSITPDEMIMIWEPILTLLSPADQRHLAERYSFDYRRYAKRTACAILLFALFGMVTTARTAINAPRVSVVIAFIVALLVSGEQLVRLAHLGSRPSGSFLQFLVRPLVKKLMSSRA